MIVAGVAIGCAGTPRRPAPPPTNTAAPAHARNAALLFMPATRDAPDRDPARRQFQPVLCAIDGALVTGTRCADLVPPRATIRVAGHATLTIVRATTFAHPDDFPTADYPSPYAPACCDYEGCQGKTIQYDVVRDARTPALADDALIAVWPPDADVGLAPGAAVPVPHRGDPKAAVIPDLLLSTTDIDHDGHRERVIYEPDANDYGIAVVQGELASPPIYAFSCGNG